MSANALTTKNTLEVQVLVRNFSKQGIKENAFHHLGEVFHCFDQLSFSRKVTERKSALLEFW